MKEIKKCFNKKMLVVVAILVGLAMVIGVGTGAKYLNKSQQEFNIINESLNKAQDEVMFKDKTIALAKNTLKEKDKIIENLKSWKDKKSFVMVNRGLLEENIKLYTDLSSEMQTLIISTVISEATKYNINPIILYSLLHVESSMRFHIQHTPTNIVLNKKKVKVRAVGLGGVVWEWWGKQLIEAKIAQTRSDLFLPQANIKATAYILNEMSKREMLKGTKSKDESMLRRYFGGNFKSYSDKIDAKVMSIVKPNLYRY